MHAACSASSKASGAKPASKLMARFAYTDRFGSNMEWSYHATGTFITSVCRYMKVNRISKLMARFAYTDRFA